MINTSDSLITFMCDFTPLPTASSNVRTSVLLVSPLPFIYTCLRVRFSRRLFRFQTGSNAETEGNEKEAEVDKSGHFGILQRLGADQKEKKKERLKFCSMNKKIYRIFPFISFHLC